MDLFSQIDADIKSAMLAKDRMRLQALRGIKKEFIEGKTAPGSNGELTDEAAMKILVKMAKQRRESARTLSGAEPPGVGTDRTRRMCRDRGLSAQGALR